MFSRSTLFAVVAAVSLMTAGLQAIAADDAPPESSVIGLGQSSAPAHR